MDRNEATTRLHLIDEILFGALQWPVDACRTEDRLDGQVTDYSLGLPATSMILEAKREGIHFELPVGGEAAVLPIQTLVEGNALLRDALKQVTDYCATRGVAIATVCNGHQLISFLGSRNDGTPPLQGRALVFHSLDDMEQHFRTLWDALSHSGITEGRLSAMLLSRAPVPAPAKLSSRLPGYYQVQRRNTLQDDLHILGEVLLEDLTEFPELTDVFLNQAYAPSGALSQNAYVSREILRHRYAAIEQTEVVQPAQERGHIAPDLFRAMSAHSLGNRPIVLLGDVGVGKTTFIKHLVRIDARAELSTAVVVNVDFRSAGFRQTRDAIGAFVESEIFRQFLDDYEIDCQSEAVVRSIYSSEVLRFRNSIYGPLRESSPESYAEREREMLQQYLADSPSHLRRSIQDIVRGRQRAVVIFLDNIDQFGQRFQEDVFLIAESLARDSLATVFISLRPTTFNLSAREGVLSAFTPRVFTVAPPRVDSVLARRFRFARNVLLAEEYGLMPFVSVESSTLRAFMSILEMSFERNDDLRDAIDCVSRGNIRNALQLLTTFIGSGHINTEKMLTIFRETGSYTIAIHEFLRAIIYGDRIFYDPGSSPIWNMFDISTNDSREHFLGGIAASLVQQLPASRGAAYGYILEAEVYERCQSLGFTQSQIASSFGRMLSKNVIEYEELPRQEEARLRRLRITRSGGYTVERLASSFVYADAVVVDTPIIDPDVRGTLRDARSIAERLERARLFRTYLDQCWSALETEMTGFDWPTHSQALGTEMEWITERSGRG